MTPNFHFHNSKEESDKYKSSFKVDIKKDTFFIAFCRCGACPFQQHLTRSLKMFSKDSFFEPRGWYTVIIIKTLPKHAC